MAESVAVSSQPERIHPFPRPLAPLWTRKWIGFPAALSPFIGRERELRALGDLLLDPQHRLIAVTGPGGVGTTRRALEGAERVEEGILDGAASMTLAGMSGPGMVLSTVAQVLNVHASRLYAAIPIRKCVIFLMRQHVRHLMMVSHQSVMRCAYGSLAITNAGQSGQSDRTG